MIDLHLHTNYSDGTDSVKELLVNANKNNLDVISITDHDSIDAYKELENKELRKLFNGKILVGVELKVYYNGIPMEVLGYGIDYKKIKINKVDMYKIQVNALEELKERAKKLNLIYDNSIAISKIDPRKKYASFVLAEEILKHEENKEILLSIGPEFDANSFYRVHISNKNSVFYYDESKYGISLEEAIESIHNAGGLAFLAHPLIYPFDDENKLDAIEILLKDYKLDGIECEYLLFNTKERKELRTLALKYNKYISGGTDYHAKNKPNIKMGTGIDDNIYIDNNDENIKDWLESIDTI